MPRQPHIMADHFRLAEARQADGAFAAQAAQPRRRQPCTSGRSTPVTPSRPSSKISALFMIQPAVAGDGRQLVVAASCAGAATGGPDCSCSSQHLFRAPLEARRNLRRCWFRWRPRSADRARWPHAAAAARRARRARHALRRQRVHHARRGLGQLHGEFVEEGRRHQLRRL